MLLILIHELAHGLTVSRSHDTVTSELRSPRSVITRNDSCVAQSSPWVSFKWCDRGPANRHFKMQLAKAETSASVQSAIQ